MDTLNKVLHPKQTLHKTDDDTDYAGTQTPPSHTNDPMRPNQETRDALTSEPNVTGTDRPAPRKEFPAPHHSNTTTTTTTSSEQEAQQAPRISRGHHHPRQPVGATGLPPNHRPGQECGPAGPGA